MNKLIKVLVGAFVIAVVINMVLHPIRLYMVEKNFDLLEKKTQLLVEKVSILEEQNNRHVTHLKEQLERSIEKGYAKLDPETDSYKWVDKDIQYIMTGEKETR